MIMTQTSSLLLLDGGLGVPYFIEVSPLLHRLKNTNQSPAYKNRVFCATFLSCRLLLY